MTGRGQVVVLWDPQHDPPPGPLLDSAALATRTWDWSYVGPMPPVRPPTMVVLREPDDVGGTLEGVDVVVGVPTHWTLEHVVTSGARFVAVVLGETESADPELEEITVEGWPSGDRWPDILDAAVVLDDGHHDVISRSKGAHEVAAEIMGLLEEIQERHLPAPFRSVD